MSSEIKSAVTVRVRVLALPDLHGQPICSPRIRPERLLPHLRTELGQACIERALELAVAPRQQAHRPIRAEDQAILAEAFGGVFDVWRQPFRVPIVPSGLGGKAGDLAPDIA